jgi:hypothetical protein
VSGCELLAVSCSLLEYQALSTGRRSRPPERPLDLSLGEPAGENHGSVSDHHRKTIAVRLLPHGVGDVDHLEVVPTPAAHGGDNRKGLLTERAVGSGEEEDRHASIVGNPMRPATVFALIALLLLIAAAGTVFVIQLVSLD